MKKAEWHPLAGPPPEGGKLDSVRGGPCEPSSAPLHGTLRNKVLFPSFPVPSRNTRKKSSTCSPGSSGDLRKMIKKNERNEDLKRKQEGGETEEDEEDCTVLEGLLRGQLQPEAPEIEWYFLAVQNSGNTQRPQFYLQNGRKKS